MEGNKVFLLQQCIYTWIDEW